MDITTRATYRGQLTKLVKSVSKYLQSPEAQVKPQNAENFDTIEEELIVFLERITVTRDSLNKANNVVRHSIKTEDMSKECESIAAYDDKAISMIARVKQRLAKLRSIQNTAMEGNQQNLLTTNQSSVKLPKLNLKKFSGDLKEWLPFWEQFRTSVHENLNLNGAEKFNYLQSLLAGQAAESIAGLTPTQSHYDTAITLLKDEYGHNDKIVDKTMRQLMALSPVHSRYDVIALRRLYNSVVASTRSLTAIGIPTSHYSIMLRSVLLRCMPSDLRIEFHRITADALEQVESSSSTKDLEPGSSYSVCSVSIVGDKQFTPILKFLKREVESLEKANEGRPSHKQSIPKMMKTATGLLLPSEVKTYCCFCKLNSHKSEDCTANLSISERKDKLKREGRCFKCTRRGHSSKTCRNRAVRCNTCTGNHATSLCDPSYSRKLSDQRLQKYDQNNAAVVKQTTNLCSSSQQSSDVYLQTACAFLSSGKAAESVYFARVVFDGCSQRSYIREEVSRKLNLEIVDTVVISILPFGITEAPPQRVCNRVRVIVKSQHYNEYVTIVAVETPDICLDTLPVPNLTSADFSNFILADSRENGDPVGGISLLIGADYYWSFIRHHHIKRLSPRLTAIKTILGWTIQGPAADEQHNKGICQITTTMALQVSLCTDNQIQKFWDLESIGIDNPSAVESDNVDINKYIKKRGQRYEASLLWRNDKIELCDNRKNALIRLDGLVKKLKRSTGKLQEYDSAMWELINSGFAERANSNLKTASRTFYMPHRPVYKEESVTTRTRIVFDASSRAQDSLSLNDNLFAGPNLLPDILSVLLNFRIGRIGLVADIEKAFLQISLAEQDRDALRFLWFQRKVDNLSELPSYDEFRMTRVPFGVTCSPFLLTSTLKKHLENESLSYPNTCRILQRSFYMDDLILSVDNDRTAFEIYTDACDILKRASMTLRKWNSNSEELRSRIQQHLITNNLQKVLGIIWFYSTDEITVDLRQVLQSVPTENVTKRIILQFVARIYDPLGILGPFVVRLKILFQETWKSKLEWNEPLPSQLLTTWNSCTADMQVLNNMVLPRCVFTSSNRTNVQLHIFADASLSAYGVVAYIRSLNEDDDISVRYLTSRNRVAPIKSSGDSELTLPKLELTAALIASRLLSFLQKNVDVTWDCAFLWSDSNIALHWINGDIRRWKPYIVHRVTEIRNLTENAT